MDLTPASSVGAPAGSPGPVQRHSCKAASWQLSSESNHGPASFPQVPQLFPRGSFPLSFISTPQLVIAFPPASAYSFPSRGIFSLSAWPVTYSLSTVGQLRPEATQQNTTPSEVLPPLQGGLCPTLRISLFPVHSFIGYPFSDLVYSFLLLSLFCIGV